MYKYTLTILTCLVLFTSCSVRDLRTNYAKQTSIENSDQKGRDLLESTYLKMGYDKFDAITTYEATSLFDWKRPWSWMPMNALPGNNRKNIQFKFARGTFDGNVEYLEGRNRDDIYGLQSWQSYHVKDDKELKKVKGSKRKWGLATYHYLIEVPSRIRNAEIVKYAGERSLDGQMYDLVFATWGEEKPHREHDQFLIYINKKTGMTDLMEITINDFFLPMPNNMKDGTVRVERQLTSIGAYLPKMIYVQLGKPKKSSKHVYNFSLTDYEFDNFPVEELYPIPGLKSVGDRKEAK